jgi:hypothetical protein
MDESEALQRAALRWSSHRFGMSTLRDSGHRIDCEEEGVLPLGEPEALPRPRVRRGNEAAVERAGAATGTGRGVMKMVEPAEMPLPSHPHAVPRRDIGAPQTSNHDPCAARHGIRSPRGVSLSPPWRATSKVPLRNSA